VAFGSILLGLIGAACLGVLMGLDTADVPHGSAADAALSVGWLTGGGLGLALGLAARETRLGKVGLALGVLAFPLGIVAFGALAIVLTT
jgi:hypothetical protein